MFLIYTPNSVILFPNEVMDRCLKTFYLEENLVSQDSHPFLLKSKSPKLVFIPLMCFQQIEV